MSQEVKNLFDFPEIYINNPLNQDSAQISRFLHTLISNLPGYIYRVAKIENEWKIQYLSEGVFEVTGYKVNELLHPTSNSYSNLVLPEDWNQEKLIVNQALDEKKSYQITYRIKTADGKIKWVWEQGRGIYDESGNLVATEGFITDITEKKLIEEEMIKRNEELAVLNHISQSLSKLAHTEEILELVYEMTGKLFDNKNFYIALYDDATKQISFPIYTVDGKLAKSTTRPFRNGLTEYVITSKKPLLIEINILSKFKELGIEMMGKKSKSLMAVPMILGEEIIGVITMQDYEKEKVFNASHIELLTTIASQAAIALKNSLLYAALQKELEEREETAKKIKASLNEKEILLQEVHHRVKNNLQIMSSLLRLQSKYLKNKDTMKIFMESENRIKSMAIIHNKLYNSKSYEKIDFVDYIKTLTNNLFLSYGINKANIVLEIDVFNILLNIDTAIPCGLIINELVSNSLKYAFKDKGKGVITISMKKDEKNAQHPSDNYVLTVKDNGIGLPDLNLKESTSLGMRLINLLTNQLGGHLTIENNKGAQFNIFFYEVMYKERTKEVNQ